MASIQEMVREILDRVVRIETRTTRYIEGQGYDTGVQRARWEPGRVIIPTDATALKEILAVIPDGWSGETIPVYVENATSPIAWIVTSYHK